MRKGLLTICICALCVLKTIAQCTFTVSMGANVTICGNQSATLQATPNPAGNYTYQWSPAGSLSNATVANPVASPTSTTNYYVSVTSGGCTIIDSQMVTVNGVAPEIVATDSPNVVFCPGTQMNLKVAIVPTLCGLAPACSSINTSGIIGSGDTAQAPSAGTGPPTILGNWNKAYRNQMLYTAAELQAALGGACTLKSLSLNIKTFNSNEYLQNFYISLSCTNLTTLTTFDNNVTQVYTASLIQPITGWNTFAFQNDYNWDGVSDLLVDICWYNPVTSFNQDNKAQCTNITNFNGYLYAFSNTGSLCGTTVAATPAALRPNIQFTYCQPDISNYNIAWTPSTGANEVSNPAIYNPTASPVTSQTYNVTVGAGGCTSTASVNVQVDTSKIVASPDISSCPGVAANLTSTVVGTVLPGPPTFTWNILNGAVVGTTQNITVNPTVNTTYVVTMNGGACPHYDTVKVLIGSLNVVDAISNVKCLGQSNGKIVVTASNGTSPYTYSWSANANTVTSTIDSAVNLAASNTPYTVTVSDVNHCTGSATAIISAPGSLPTTSFTLTQPKCFGGSDGAVIVTPSGGTPGYTYAWNNPLPPVAHQTGLAAGNYSVTVTDLNGCSVSSSVPLSGPTQITFGNAVIKNERCAGGSTGSITVSATGGTGGYTYLWSNALTTQTITNLIATAYIITVTDANFCTASATYSVTQPGGVTFTAPTIDSTKCFGSSDGSAEIFPSGGTLPYTYLWSPSNQTTQTATGLSAQTYSVTVTDDSLCTTVTRVTIPQPGQIQIAGTVTNISCAGSNDGSIAITTPPLNAYQPVGYAWSPGGANTATISGLPATTYDVIVTDAHGCNNSASFTVSEPPALVLNAPTQTNVSCFGNSTGSLTANATGGTGAYTYAWSNTLTTQTISGLTAGPYSVIVSDVRSCTVSAAYAITQPASLPVFGTATVTNVLCHGGATGAIINNVTGGTPGYTYAWSPNSQFNDSSATGLTANTYFITATDANGCTVTTNNTITEPPAITIDTTLVIEDSCHGESNGAITVNAQGGIGAPYTYTWNGVANGNSETGLAAGSYNIVAMDGNNCPASITVVITEPAPILTSLVISNVLCYGDSDGSITVTPNGGNQPYTYAWNNGETSALDAHLYFAGNPYIVTVTDNTGCTATATGNVSQPLTALSFTDTATQVKCPGQKNGTISAFPTGGTAPYDFSVSKDGENFVNAPTGTAYGLDSGYYGIYVSDTNGCVDTAGVFVPSPVKDSFNLTVDSTSCYGSTYRDGSITVTPLVAHNTPFTYTIDGGSVQDTSYFGNLGAGPHQIIATNQFGCPSTLDTTVYQPQQGFASVLPKDTTLQLGQSLTLQSGFGPFPPSSITSYNWVPSVGLSCVDCPSPVVTPYGHVSVYTLSITYNGDCVASDSMEIIVKNGLQFFIPNSFTPNGDGTNDVFEIYGEGIKTVVLRVYNRWGEKVFESASQFNGWDGTYKGIMQNPGVYVYDAQITFLDDTKAEKHGSITLIR